MAVEITGSEQPYDDNLDGRHELRPNGYSEVPDVSVTNEVYSE